MICSWSSFQCGGGSCSLMPLHQQQQQQQHQEKSLVRVMRKYSLSASLCSSLLFRLHYLGWYSYRSSSSSSSTLFPLPLSLSLSLHLSNWPFPPLPPLPCHPIAATLLPDDDDDDDDGEERPAHRLLYSTLVAVYISSLCFDYACARMAPSPTTTSPQHPRPTTLVKTTTSI